HRLAILNTTRCSVIGMNGQPQLRIIEFAENARDHFVIAWTDEGQRVGFLFDWLVAERRLAQHGWSQLRFLIRGARKNGAELDRRSWKIVLLILTSGECR